VEFLVEQGADINARTKGQGRGAAGGTPLWWALESHNEDHPIVAALRKMGAKNFGPGDAHEL